MTSYIKQCFVPITWYLCNAYIYRIQLILQKVMTIGYEKTFLQLTHMMYAFDVSFLKSIIYHYDLTSKKDCEKYFQSASLKTSSDSPQNMSWNENWANVYGRAGSGKCKDKLCPLCQNDCTFHIEEV